MQPQAIGKDRVKRGPDGVQQIKRLETETGKKKFLG